MRYIQAIRRFFRAYWQSLSPFSRAALIRAAKTMAQVAAASLATSGHLSGIHWRETVDLVGMSGLLSLLTSVSTGLPEAGGKAGKDVDDSTGKS